MESDLSVIGILVGIITFIVVVRNWRSLSLLEWIGGFIFAGVAGSLLGWLWVILPDSEREAYMSYLTIGAFGLFLLHFGDVINSSIRGLFESLQNREGKKHEPGYEPGCAYAAFILVVVGLVLILEPFLHLIERTWAFIELVFDQLAEIIQSIDIQLNNNLWLIVVGLAILALGYVLYTGRRHKSNVRALLRELEPPSGGCAIPMVVMLLGLIFGAGALLTAI